MCHYHAELIHGLVNPANPQVGMVIECDAPSPQDVADILFTMASTTARIIAGVTIVEALTGWPMAPGDVARIVDTNHPDDIVELECTIAGWVPAAA